MAAMTVALLFLGAAFMLLAAVGLTRLPDLFTRMQAATKAGVLGAGSVLLAVAVHFEDAGVSSRALATIVFIVLSTPVAAHMIARAAYFVGVPLWEKNVVDELRGKYDPETHELGSGERQGGDERASGEGPV